MHCRLCTAGVCGPGAVEDSDAQPSQQATFQSRMEGCEGGRTLASPGVPATCCHAFHVGMLVLWDREGLQRCGALEWLVVVMLCSFVPRRVVVSTFVCPGRNH